MNQYIHKKATVRERRNMWRENADENVNGWVCESCGDLNEEYLVIYATGRVTRSDPSGMNSKCLCCDCADRIPQGVIVND